MAEPATFSPEALFKALISLFQPPSDPLLTVLWYGVALAIAGAVTWYLVRGFQVQASLRRKVAALKAVQKDQIVESLGTLDAAFAEDHRFNKHWLEFRGSLVKRTDAALTTIDAGAFFNEFSLVDQPMWMEFSRHVPGMLTAIGIIGTFGGLITGLAGFDDKNLESSIVHLLIGVHDAFACSFLAISGAVLITVVERGLISSLYGQVHEVQENFNRLFNRSITENYLQEMVRHMGQQSQTLKSFSQDLAESIRMAMQELVAQQTTALSNSNQMIADQIKSSMEGILEPAVDRLTKAVEDTQRQSAESSQGALRDLVGQFSETLASTTGRQMDGLMAAIAGSTDTMATLQGEMSAFVHSVQAQMVAQQVQMQAQMEALSTNNASQQHALQAELGRFVEETARTLAALQHQMAEQSGASVTRVGEELTNMVAKFQARQEEALVRLSDKMSTMHGELDRKLTAALEDVSRSSQANTTQLAESVNATVAQLQEQASLIIKNTQVGTGNMVQQLSERTAHVLESTDRLSAQVSQQSAQLSQAVEAMLRQTQASTGEMAAQQERYALQLTTLMKELEHTLTGFDQRLERQRTLVETMAGGLEQFRSASSLLADSSKSYAATHQQTQLVLGQITHQVQTVDARLTELDRFNQAIKSTVDQQGRMMGELKGDTAAFFGEVRGQVDQYRDAVQESMTRYNTVAKSGLDGFLGEVSTKLGGAVLSIGQTVNELDERLDELSGALEDLSKVVGQAGKR